MPVDPRGLAVTPNAYFSLLTLDKQLLIATFYDTTAGIGTSFWTHGQMDAWTDGQTLGRRRDKQTWKSK